MADFLSTFGLGADNPAPVASGLCNSVDELALHLRDALFPANKTSETKVEHVALTLELRNTVQFHLGLSESENEALEGLNNVDPSLEGVRSASLSVDPAGGQGQATRVVAANDTLMDQSDNPVLQRTVAKHILGAVSAIDGSNWTIRDLSRGQQGWTFTYICRYSLQHWTRHNAKNPHKAIICEYSQREPDPNLMSRPAFDCRGSIAIAFNRSSRSITVKYDHTLFHKTVEELSKLYPTPERNFGPGYQRQQQQKTPKKPSDEEKEREKQEKREKKREEKERKKQERKERREKEIAERAERKEKEPKKNKRVADGGQDGELGERPKKRKKKSAKDQAAAQDGPAMPPNYPGEPPLDGASQPTYGAAQSGGGAESYSGYPQGLPGDNATSNGGQRQQSGAPSSGVLTFSVSPEEAARRLAIAKKLLTDSGVDPETLSSDQMNIFANQSPELQKDSVAMLAKYGAERLQIIHPNNKDKTASEQSSSSATPANNGTPMTTTTKELVLPESQASGNKGRGKGAAAKASGPDGTPTKRKMAKSRVACFQCKGRKVKCPKERPTCAACEAEGLTCEFPPQRPGKEKKSKAVVTVDDDEPDEEGVQQQGQQQPQPETVEPDQTYHPEPHPGAQDAVPQDISYSQMPVADMLTPSVTEDRPTEPGYFQAASGLALPQPGMAQVSQQALSSASGLVLPQGQPAFNGVPAPTMDAPPEIPASTSSVQRTSSGGGGARRRLPGGPSGGDANRGDQTMNMAPSDSWIGASNPSMGSTTTTNAAAAAAAGLAQQGTRSQQPSRQSNTRTSTDSPQMRDSMAQPINNQAAPVKQVPPAQQSPSMVAAMQAQARTSPFQAGGHQRSNFRQPHRAQSGTPNADQSMARGYYPPGQNQQVGQASDLVGSSNYNNYRRYLGVNMGSDDQSGSRITYEPFSQHQHQQTTAPSSLSYPAYDYDRSTSTTMAPFNNTATSTSTTNNNQWPSSQQSRSSRPYEKPTAAAATGHHSGSYTPQPQPQQQQQQQQPAPSQGSASLRNFDMRASAQKRPSSGAMSSGRKPRHQQQPQQPASSYPSYPPQSQSHDQQQQQHQQMGQHGSWNYLGSNNHFF